jgi:hypothetical protein
VTEPSFAVYSGRPWEQALPVLPLLLDEVPPLDEELLDEELPLDEELLDDEAPPPAPPVPVVPEVPDADEHAAQRMIGRMSERGSMSSPCEAG